jgi:hypothetical protein
MMSPHLPSTVWKWLLIVLVACSATLLVIDFSNALGVLLVARDDAPLKGQRAYGTLGINPETPIGPDPATLGTHALTIQSLAPDSPLHALCARRGDSVRFDHYRTGWRMLAPGEQVGLTLHQAAGVRPECGPDGKPGPALAQSARSQHALLTAVAAAVTPAIQMDYWSRFLLATPALLFALLIGLKQAAAPAYRSLSTMFLALSLMLYFTANYAPPSLLFTIGKLANITTFPLLWFWCAKFALSYHGANPDRLHGALVRGLWWYRPLALATAMYSLWFGLGNEAPALGPALMLTMLGGLVIGLLGLVNGWQRSGGDLRQRHLWLMLALALGTIPALLVWIPALDAAWRKVPLTFIAMVACQFLMYLGLAYAVLMHRVFNFDFAVSRALVFSVISLTLLCSFGLIEWFSESLLHPDAQPSGHRQTTLLLDAGVALFVFLVFHAVHHRLEQGLERLFFRRWHENEHRLRKYVQQAAHITTADALLDSLRLAIDRFTGLAGCAIYLRADGGQFALAASTIERAPNAIDQNDDVPVALRTEASPLLYGALLTALPGELALPMSQRGTLDGFIVLGSKRRGQSYRPDEREVLGFAAHQVGLDLHALRVVALEAELRRLEHETQQQGDELLLMAGRRKKVRPPPEPDAPDDIASRA